MFEEWMPVPGWPRYRVSNRGVLIGPRGKPLAGYIDKNGYHCIYLGPRKAGQAAKIHRLVVSAFVGPIPEGLQVNHKNGKKADNRLENLEVVTGKENVLHSFRELGRKPTIGKRYKGSEHHNARWTEEQVTEMRRLYSEGRTQKQIAEMFGTTQSAISQITRRSGWNHIP